jgi:hypothetical protein
MASSAAMKVDKPKKEIRDTCPEEEGTQTKRESEKLDVHTGRIHQ